MTFAECIPLLLQGKKIARKEWANSGYYIWLDPSYEDYLVPNSDTSIDINRADLKAKDWEVVK